MIVFGGIPNNISSVLGESHRWPKRQMGGGKTPSNLMTLHAKKLAKSGSNAATEIRAKSILAYS